MYHQYYGLKEAPFSIAVNPRYLFMSPRHRDALAHLLYGVGAGGGFILLTGEVGTGKTTINRCLLEQLPDDTDIAIILNPALDSLELLASVCDELGIDYAGEASSLKTLTDKLHAFLLANHARGRKTVLLIDEAQHLNFDVLEQIRLLTNLETNHEKLLQIVLIGQPELASLLQRPELRQLNQRITARYNLEPLNLEETRAYIRHRLQVAGLTADRELFPPAAVRDIHRLTRGIPRLINVLCDRALLGAYGQNKGRVERSMVATAAREVMGEEGVQRPPSRLGWALAVVVLLGLAGTAWWWLGQPRGWQRQLPAQVAVEAPAVVTTPPAQQPEPEPEPESEPEAGQQAWNMTSAAAGQLLWRLQAPAAVAPPEPCPAQPMHGLGCYREQVQTWDALLAYDRPLVLELITPERFRAAAVLLGLSGQQARLATADGGVVEVSLRELAGLWQGDFYLLWQVPDGYRAPLALGDRGPAVAAVARLFAALDNQPRALAESQFNRALQSRVELFQRAHQLEADGVVGVRTLLKLNEQLGIDPSRAQSEELL
ncbi:ExeA family protein [Parahaliea aestuarii]|uniref:AAA family ATPase n=1 Tax=Parahaliea aestuarii TaxID=1852021 RepID=A0A5C8ZUM7_9GAMM|nr:AAA family ATPase [Parahaliea aestuarii]TXS91519.1 AAA family ATPase [Parahaliea aestuarii]